MMSVRESVLPWLRVIHGWPAGAGPIGDRVVLPDFSRHDLACCVGRRGAAGSNPGPGPADQRWQCLPLTFSESAR
jgi:hypothetical protein